MIANSFTAGDQASFGFASMIGDLASRMSDSYRRT